MSRHGVLDTPIYTALIREQARRDAAAYVASLRRPATPPCPVCGVLLGGCRTTTGKPARRPHTGRQL